MMRRTSALDALLPQTRQGILAATLLHPDRWWYLSDLARYLEVTPSTLQRDLKALVEVGILRRRRDGNRVYYQADPACPFLADLQGLLAKTAGIADVLRAQLEPLGEAIRIAFVYGSMARGEAGASSDVDLMVIGAVGLAELAPLLREAEARLQRAVNPMVFTEQELRQKVEAGHHFVSAVLAADKIFLKGSPDELDAVAGRTAGQPAHHEPAGTG